LIPDILWIILPDFASNLLAHSYPQPHPGVFHGGFTTQKPFLNSKIVKFYMKSALTIITKLLIYSQI